MTTAVEGRKKDRKRRPDEMLASVVRETAIPAAVELLRGNGRFEFPSGTAWVILVLAAETLGGLSKRHGRDEAKGSIIELIESDQIRTVATADMLAEEIFGIIPTPETLSRMEEYGLLTEAEYAWAVVYQEGGHDLRVDLVAGADFGQACEVAVGTVSLRNAVGEQAWANHSGEAAPDDQAMADVAGVDSPAMDAADAPRAGSHPRSVFGDDEGDPLFVDVPEVDADVDAAADGPVFSDVVDEEGTDALGFDQDGPVFDDERVGEFLDDDDEYGAGEGRTDDEAGGGALVADQDQVRATIARRFLGEDLDLNIGLDEFNTSFGIGAPVVQIDVPDGASDWLGDQVARLTRQANADLARAHEASQAALREKYVSLMSLHAEQVIRDVAVDRAGSRYKALHDQAEVEHNQRLANKEAVAHARRREIAEEYREAAVKAGRQAALQAEVGYAERTRARMQREQVDAVAEIERLAENTYSDVRCRILDVRRKEAALRMQIGQTRVMELLCEQQDENRAVVQGLMASWSAQIQRVIDENRKNDISRSETMAEEQSRTDRVALLQEQQQAALEAMRTEHADRIGRMEGELERTRQEAIGQLRARDQQWQHCLEFEKGQTDAQAARARDLLAQMRHMGTVFQQQYDARINDLKADRQAYIHDLERSNAMQSRWNKLQHALLLSIGLLMFIAGIIGGALWF
ncbi:hypothetical protein ACFOY4_01710 [Actinomadura syzygii]|uniref:Uncharacterized protein n=1 Tax=Actinomadura syzygii TaxID=1427538 RepID=A0A5D0TT79_9ACTN|nr:hypothetical protein [Actinomadura syzygii]TYC08542.1 hypothetical protein FXF65_37235 [Actinomadura syzygii]